MIFLQPTHRLTRLKREDWEKLKAVIKARGVHIVALDVPTSHRAMSASPDDFTGNILDAINSMLLDIVAAVANKDYQDRRRRAAQGIAKAKAEGRFKGRPEDTRRNAAIMGMLRRGISWGAIIDAVSNGGTTLSRSTLAKLAKRVKEETAPG